MYKPLVSVILPLYNEPIGYAVDAIDSVLGQTYGNLEVWLILDKPDNKELAQLIQNYKETDSRVSIVINDRNLGLPETLNKGIRLSSGKYIARMDGDDVSRPDRIEKQVRYLEEHPGVDLVGSDAVIIDEDSNAIGLYRKFRSDFAQKMMLRYVGSNLIHPTWLGRNDIFNRIGYRNFWYCEDYDFLLRAYAEGFHFHNIQIPLLSYRIVQRSVRSISREKAYEQRINARTARALYKRYLKSPESEYPAIPKLQYEQADASRYQAAVLEINRLRTFIGQKRFHKALCPAFSILRCYPSLLTGYMRTACIRGLLWLREKINTRE